MSINNKQWLLWLAHDGISNVKIERMPFYFNELYLQNEKRFLILLILFLIF